MSEDIEKIERATRRVRAAIEAMPSAARPIGFRDFPSGACGDASLVLAECLLRLGLGEFSYVVRFRSGRDNHSRLSHAWLERGELVVDITADQFLDAPSAVVVAIGSEWHATFERDACYPPCPARLATWHRGGIDELRWFSESLLRAIADA